MVGSTIATPLVMHARASDMKLLEQSVAVAVRA